MAWWITVSGLILLFVAVAFRWGPGRSLATVVPVTWLAPAWLMLPIAEGAPNSIVGSGLDVKVTVSSACLVLYCFMPGRRFPTQLVPTDFALLGLIIIHLMVDSVRDGFDWFVLGRAYAEWYLPYVAGRLAIQSADDVRHVWRTLVTVGLGLAISAIIEAFMSSNPFEWIVGERPLEGFRRDASRWGLRRAYGPTMHPIYLGVLQLLLLGWAGYSNLLALHRRASPFWFLSTLLIVAGIVATGSRGPILGTFVAIIVFVFFLFPRTRMAIGIFASVMIVLAAVFHEPIIRQLERWSGERQWEIQIDGESRLTSSVRSRVNVLGVNRIAIKRSGLMGFGTQSVSGFPVNVPLGPIEAEAIKSVWAIDNSYILLMLRFGYLGVSIFILSAALSIWQFYWIGQQNRGQAVQWLCGSVGAVTLATLLVQCTVWMPHEIGFPLLWTFGISAGLMVAHRDEQLSA